MRTGIVVSHPNGMMHDSSSGRSFIIANGAKQSPGRGSIRSEQIPGEDLVRHIGNVRRHAVGNDDVAIFLEGSQITHDL